MLFNFNNEENIGIDKIMNNPGGHSHVSVNLEMVAQSRMVFSRDWEVGEMGRCWPKVKHLVTR